MPRSSGGALLAFSLSIILSGHYDQVLNVTRGEPLPPFSEVRGRDHNLGLGEVARMENRDESVAFWWAERTSNAPRPISLRFKP